MVDILFENDWSKEPMSPSVKKQILKRSLVQFISPEIISKAQNASSISEFGNKKFIDRIVVSYFPDLNYYQLEVIPCMCNKKPSHIFFTGDVKLVAPNCPSDMDFIVKHLSTLIHELP